MRARSPPRGSLPRCGVCCAFAPAAAGIAASRFACAAARGTDRSAAFPIIELLISTCLAIWIAIGATLGVLDAPDRLWPWFSLGFASLYTVAAQTMAKEGGAAIVLAVLTGAPLAWAGLRVNALDYGAIAWMCWIAAGIALVVALGRTLAGRRRS